MKRIKEYSLVYHTSELCPLCYTGLDFQIDLDSRKSTSEYVFILRGGVTWRSMKQKYIAHSIMEAEYVATL